MALTEIPTGVLPEVIVDTLPEVGEENKVYRRLVEDEELREMQFTDDFIWYDGEYHPFSFDAKVFGAYFERYQRSVMQTIGELETRIAELEGGGGGSKLLFEGSNISLKESWDTIGNIIEIESNVETSHGTTCRIALSNMTVDGKPIEDVTDTISLYGLPSWNWQGGEVYSDVFGNSAYFSFGTMPLNGIAAQVTLGFTNEQENFTSRTLVIGHIKVEVV